MNESNQEVKNRIFWYEGDTVKIMGKLNSVIYLVMYITTELRIEVLYLLIVLKNKK